MSVLLPHWPVPVSTLTTLTCTWMSYHCYMCMSLLLPLWTVHVSTVTTFTYISLYCYHTNLYLSALLPHRPHVPVNCYHTDLSQSILLPTWHVPVSTVTTNVYVYLLLSHWPVNVCPVIRPVPISAVTKLTVHVCQVPLWPLHVSSVTGERGGSVVECRTPEREVWGSKPTAAVLCPWARHFTPRKYWLITQEAMAPSRHDWKIVDWDVKSQHNQNLLLPLLPVSVSTVTRLIYTCLSCYHTDLMYPSTVTTRTCSSLYCYHIDTCTCHYCYH